MANLIGKDEEALNALPNVPLGVSKWDVLRNRNYLIVDKTAKLAKLVEFNMVFFARPRRMGKSTLCSMLYELFAHGTDKFVGQKIYDLWPEEKGRTYPVIRLSFNSIQGKDASDFEQALKGAVANAFSTAGFTEVKSFDQTKSLSGFLSQFNVIADQHWLVFLIDEWDHQLSNSLDKEDDFNLFKATLSIFYSWLRNLPKLRFVLVTGIMRYRETSLFSGQDIQDLSMEPYFADLLGYTQDELQHAFQDYIPLACQRMNLSEEKLLHLLQVHYDGFCFDYNASVKVYCPYAINQFFAVVKYPDVVPYFGHYWMTSANASAALIEYLRRRELEADELKQICQQQFTLSYQEITDASFFGTVSFKQLLVQAGYFSIESIAKNAASPEARKFNCVITNKDVSKAFFPVLASYLLHFDQDKQRKLEQACTETQQALLVGDIAHMCVLFNLNLCKAGYTVLQDAKEALYACFFEMYLQSDPILTAREEINSLGRCDLVAETSDRIFVFELKRLNQSSSSQNARRAMLDVAEQQILSRGYGSSRMDRDKPITGVLLVICDKYRQVCAWRTLDVTETGQLEHHEGFVEMLNIATQMQVRQLAHKARNLVSTIIKMVREVVR